MLQSSYGQADDYFDIDDTGPKIGPYKRPVLLTLFAPFFFKSPDVYAVELHSFHESFTLARWSSFVHKVDQSIRDSNLLVCCPLICFVSAIPNALQRQPCSCPRMWGFSPGVTVGGKAALINQRPHRSCRTFRSFAAWAALLSVLPSLSNTVPKAPIRHYER